MSLTIRFVAAIDTQQGGTLTEGEVAGVLSAAGLAPGDPASFGVTPRASDPRYVLVRAAVLADDPEDVQSRVRAALTERGVVLVDYRFTAEPAQPTPLRAAGVAFDEATGTLRVEATELEEDLTLELVRGSDRITGVVTRTEAEKEAIGGVQRVVVRRAGG
jgi:hypothetical protein